MTDANQTVLLRTHGSPALPTLIYLPGIHGDWTLVSSFRAAMTNHVRFVEFSYPRTTHWTLDDYAVAIEAALAANGIHHGWLLGESFGSQPAWQIIRRHLAGANTFRPEGLVLAGGFVKHPWPWGARLLRRLTLRMPRILLRRMLAGYAAYARRRHRCAPETLASVREFVANRLHPGDPAAMARRYTLVAESDVRPTARAYGGPVFQLAGLVDPIVPNPLVRRWLRRHCPGFRASRTILRADHNVLGTAPETCAQLVATWLAA